MFVFINLTVSITYQQKLWIVSLTKFMKGFK